MSKREGVWCSGLLAIQKEAQCTCVDRIKGARGFYDGKNNHVADQA